MSADKKMKWADDEEEDEYETPVDQNGIKQRIRVTKNAKGQTVKTTTKIRVREVKTKIPVRVIRRRTLPKFGDAQDGEVNVTIPSRDFVFIEHPDDANTEDVDDPALGNTLANFILKQQERNFERTYDVDGLVAASNNEGGNAADVGGKGGDGPAGGKYVPPSQRGGGGMDVRSSSAFDPKGGAGERDQENTIRVSNLTKSVTDDDLRELFSRFGKIFRISLPRIEKKDDFGNMFKESRGFAYVAYYERPDAESAMQMLQGHGYDHLILKLEWAKPPAKEGGEGGGGSGDRFRSGYGQKLAQDTKEQVSYASNLTGNTR
jgi:translation initiation factor 3 subunit G